MQDTKLIPTFKAFMESSLDYVLPAPGGALADGGVMCDQPVDTFLAEIAAGAKKEAINSGKPPLAYFTRRIEEMSGPVIFDAKTDVAIMQRVMEWGMEFSH